MGATHTYLWFLPPMQRVRPVNDVSSDMHSCNIGYNGMSAVAELPPAPEGARHQPVDEELLGFLLDQGKITIRQRDAFGRNQELTISLRDAADIFERAATDHRLYDDIDRDDVDHIRNELLPLFSFED